MPPAHARACGKGRPGNGQAGVGNVRPRAVAAVGLLQGDGQRIQFGGIEGFGNADAEGDGLHAAGQAQGGERHGAAVGLLVGLWLFSRKNKIPYIWSLDRIGILVAISGALVRIGNFMNSEIFGRPTSLPWGVEFVLSNEWNTLYKGLPCHPTQLYEALAYLIIFVVFLWLYYRKNLAQRRPGAMFGIFLIALFGIRFLIEFIKNPQEDFEVGMILNMGQLLSIPFIVAGCVLLYRAYRAPEKKLEKK